MTPSERGRKFHVAVEMLFAALAAQPVQRHADPHPLANQPALWVTQYGRRQVTVEDWSDRVSGVAWFNQIGNPAAIQYACRVLLEELPQDNEVVYVKANGLGHLVHASQLRPVDDEVCLS